MSLLHKYNFWLVTHRSHSFKIREGVVCEVVEFEAIVECREEVFKSSLRAVVEQDIVHVDLHGAGEVGESLRIRLVVELEEAFGLSVSRMVRRVARQRGWVPGDAGLDERLEQGVVIW